MYAQNLSAAVDSTVQTALGAAYTGQPNCVRYSLAGGWNGNTDGDYGWNGINVYYGGSLIWWNTYGNNPQNANYVSGEIYSYGHTGDASSNPWLRADTTYTWKTRAAGTAGNPESGFLSTQWSLKTIARALTFGSSTLSNPTKTSVDVYVSWYPNTGESTAQMTVYYKKRADTAWTQWSAYILYAQMGYLASIFSTTISGLESGTTYDFKAVVSRTVVPAEGETTWALGSKDTLPAAPTVETYPATAVGDTSAVMNALIDPNTITCSLSFEYGTTSGALNLTTGAIGVVGDGNRYEAILQSGLAYLTTYYFRAKVTYDLGAGLVTIYGSEQSFATSIDPGIVARQEEHMQTLQFDGKYATAASFTFTLRQLAAASSDLYYAGAEPGKTGNSTSAAEVEVFRDGQYYATPLDIVTKNTSGTGYIWTIALTAAHMTAGVVDIILHSTNTADRPFRNQHLQIRTAIKTSQLDIDATNGPTNSTALTCIGNGSGDGIKAVGGASGLDINAILESNWLRVGAARTMATPESNRIRLDAASSSTDDYYNGAIVAILSGAGAGQSRIAVGYVGGADPDTDGTREVIVDTDWVGSVPDDTSIYALAPGPRTWEMRSPGELDSLPDEKSSYGEFLRLIFQRFAFKIDQNADYQTWYQADNTNTFASRAVEDDGNTQRLYRLSE